jgi:hypothetical protein
MAGLMLGRQDRAYQNIGERCVNILNWISHVCRAIAVNCKARQLNQDDGDASN